MHEWLPLVLVPVLAACSATEGQLLFRKQAPDGAASDASVPSSDVVRAGMSLQYQITDELDTNVNAELFVVDLFDVDSQQVTQLHAAGKVVMAYVSVGTRESWRPDAGRFPQASIGRTLANYPDETWLDVRNTEVRAAMQARFQRAVAKGFDGVFASGFGAYRQNSGFDVTRADELDYHRFLTGAAHALDLSIGLSSDFELAADLQTEYDWAIAMGCIARDSCAELAPFTARGLPVFDLETEGEHATVCARAKSLGISVTFKNSHFDAMRSTCP